MNFFLAIAFAIIGGVGIGSFITSVCLTYMNPTDENDYWEDEEWK